MSSGGELKDFSAIELPPPSEGGDVEEIIPTRNSIVHACTTHAANIIHVMACNLHALNMSWHANFML